jgi:hypothetical protein
MAKVEMVTDHGKIVSLKIDGKDRLKRDLVKAQGTTFWRLYDAGIAQNPFSGRTVKLTDLEMTVYQFCKAWYSRFGRGQNTEVPVQVHDWMKGLLLAINSNAYMTLLD